jgi:hypothetical protein
MRWMWEMWREGGAKSDESGVAIGMGNEIWCYVWTCAFLRDISIVIQESAEA